MTTEPPPYTGPSAAQPPSYVPPPVTASRPSFFGDPLLNTATSDTAATSDAAGPAYSGFWRRYWARVVTSLALSVVFILGLNAIRFITGFAYSSMQTCTISGSYRICTGEDLALVAGGIAAWIFIVAISYSAWSRRLSTHGATIGMQQMGLVIRDATQGAPPSKRRAFGRTAISQFPVVVSAVIPALVLFDADDSWQVNAQIIGGLVTLLLIPLGLWMLVDRRRQTAWDRAANTVVIVEHEPSWLALIALLFGSLVPAVAVGATLYLLGGDRQVDLRDYSSDGTTFADLLIFVVPVLLITLPAIIFGHLGLRETRWEARRRSGRGMALTGTLLGYSVPVIALAVAAFTFTSDRIEGLNERSCDQVRTDTVEALESYRTLNGIYPDALSKLASGVYLGEEPKSANWRYAAQADAYTLEGTGDCDGV